MTNSSRTANLSDYTTTDLVIWNPRFPHNGDNAPIGGSYPLDCFEPAGSDAEQANEDGTLYLQIPHCAGGDYYGTSVELANHRAFMSEYGHIPGVVGTTSYPGGFGVVVKLSTVENNDDMAETINALYEYPVIDDEMLSEVEREIIEESESDFHDDTRKYLIARFDDNASVAELVEDAIDAMDYKVFMRELEVVGDGIGEYWTIETCTSAYFDVEKVIDSMSDEEIATLININADDLIAKPDLPDTDDVSLSKDSDPAEVVADIHSQLSELFYQR